MFQIDNQSRRAVYEQVVEQTERFVLTGLLPAGEKMPSVRSLAMSLGVNPNTVQRAYTELERSGIIVTSPGRGAFVSTDAIEILKDIRKNASAKELSALITQLRLAGMEKEQVLSLIEQAFKEELQQ